MRDLISRKAANEQKPEESLLKSDLDSVSEGDAVYRQLATILCSRIAQTEPKTSDSGSIDSEKPEIKTDRTTDDTISRAAAAQHEMTLTLNNPLTEEQWDAIADVDFEHTNEVVFHTKHGKEVKFVKASAQPAPDCFLPVWGDCSYAETGCSDCEIKAKITKALELFGNPEQPAQPEYTEQDVKEAYHTGFSVGMEAAQAERKTGKWVDGKLDWRGIVMERYCSECGQLLTSAKTVRMNFCPNCGADMRGKQDDV